MAVNKNLPNYITGLRILGTLVLLFLESLSLPFYIVYILAGITDVLDGMIARLTNSTSTFGARLDSVADILFYAVLLIKILPALAAALPAVIWYMVTIVLLVRACSYMVAFVKYKKFASVHTYMNKLTGASIFVYPFFLALPIAFPAAVCVCVIGGLASFEELLIHAVAKDYQEGTKTIFAMH